MPTWGYFICLVHTYIMTWICTYTTMTGDTKTTTINGKDLSDAIDKLCRETRVGSILKVVDRNGVQWL